MDILSWLKTWYTNECNGDWEHQFGVLIQTTDNPGWHIRIDLRETFFADIHPVDESVNNAVDDWFKYEIKNGEFNAYGDTNKLDFLLNKFRDIIEGHKNHAGSLKNNKEDQKKIIDTCSLLKNNSIDIIEGLGELINLRYKLYLTKKERILFKPIEDFLFHIEKDYQLDENIRKGFSENYIKNLNKKLLDYIAREKSIMIKACDKIIKYVNEMSHNCGIQ